MLQIIGLLAISWLLIWLFYKKDLSVLGLKPTEKRMKYFILLFIASSVISTTSFLLRMYYAKEVYTLSHSLTARTIGLECWHQFRSVLTEELLCRGALLYLLIKKTGRLNAILISSIIFAILHWMNAGVWGNMIQMFIVFAFTFSMGLLLAYAYARTFSLLLPFAIHFGWNVVQNFIFPDSSAGNHMFTLATPPPSVTISYAALFTMLLLPKITVLLVDYFIVKSHQRVNVIP